jgi:hypothetical protein
MSFICLIYVQYVFSGTIGSAAENLNSSFILKAQNGIPLLSIKAMYPCSTAAYRFYVLPVGGVVPDGSHVHP